MLTVLVFWSWVLLLPQLPPASRSLRWFPCASILLHGPLDICLDLLPAATLPRVQKRDAQHMLLQHRGADAENPPPGKCWNIPGNSGLPVQDCSNGKQKAHRGNSGNHSGDPNFGIIAEGLAFYTSKTPCEKIPLTYPNGPRVPKTREFIFQAKTFQS